MAFSFRKMLSNIVYFKRPQTDEPNLNDSVGNKRKCSSFTDTQSTEKHFEKNELDLSSRRFANSVKRVSDPVRYFSAQKNSLSDTDLFNIQLNSPKDHRRSKKLRLDIDRANRSVDSLNCNPYANEIVEHTPKQISLGMRPHSNCEGVAIRQVDFDKSLDNIFAFSDSESMSDELENLDLESLSDNEDSDSLAECIEDKGSIPLCRKVREPESNQISTVQCKVRRSVSLDSFSDVEADHNEDERVTLLLSYQMKIEKLDRVLRQLLTEFQFHIEVSKVFQCKSFMTTLPGSDVTRLPKILGDVTRMDISRGASPSGSWNIVMEKEDTATKSKLHQQLISMKEFIEKFVANNLQMEGTHPDINLEIPAGNSTMANTPLNLDSQKRPIKPKTTATRTPKKIRINRQKYERRMNEFPDLREVLQNLFMLDGERSQCTIDASVSVNNVTALMSEFEESNASKCTCVCPVHKSTDDSSVKSTDSGLPTKLDGKSDTICSSIGDFTLDNSQLTAYSESLEQVLSYNSFNDSSLFSTMLHKSAIERITFYVQVHSIQMTSAQDRDESMESRVISFCCQACCFNDIQDEQTLLKHILGQSHCEKLHFLYKTAYIKRCFASGEEIKPSTILNSMTMYRDDNKIVCFGDSKFACSLCFENGIVGESVLMAHCHKPDHVEKRNRLDEILQECETE